MKRLFLALAVLALAVTAIRSQEPPSARAALIARAKSLELNTPYVAPPGDALEPCISSLRSHGLDRHRMSGFITN